MQMADYNLYLLFQGRLRHYLITYLISASLTHVVARRNGGPLADEARSEVTESWLNIGTCF